jgi:hypothetical protein
VATPSHSLKEEGWQRSRDRDDARTPRRSTAFVAGCAGCVFAGRLGTTRRAGSGTADDRVRADRQWLGGSRVGASTSRGARSSPLGQGGPQRGGERVNDGGLVIDLSRMRRSRRPRDENGARAGRRHLGRHGPGDAALRPGRPRRSRLDDRDRRPDPPRRVGHLRRKHGLSIDSLLSVDIVTADGVLRRRARPRTRISSGRCAAPAATSAWSRPVEFRAHPIGPGW